MMLVIIAKLWNLESLLGTARTEVMLMLYGLFFDGNNPMQAEECSHAGLHCNYFCRTCEVGRTKKYKESDEGYKSIFVVCRIFLYYPSPY
jgi:hypothetical protein